MSVNSRINILMDKEIYIVCNKLLMCSCLIFQVMDQSITSSSPLNQPLNDFAFKRFLISQSKNYRTTFLLSVLPLWNLGYIPSTVFFLWHVLPSIPTKDIIWRERHQIGKKYKFSFKHTWVDVVLMLYNNLERIGTQKIKVKDHISKEKLLQKKKKKKKRQ